MGKPTGFMNYNRVTGPALPPEERIRDFQEFHRRLPHRSRKNRAQDVWNAAYRSVSPDR